MSHFDSKQLRNVLGHYPTGVTIITAMDTAGSPFGMTANSFASVSLDPPLILWSVGAEGSGHDIFVEAEHFCVHFLSQEQEDLSSLFADKQENRFENIDWSPGKLGAPLLPGCMCRIQCTREAVYPGGDHSIILGKAVYIESTQEKKPLVFHQGQYGTVKNA